MRFSTLLAALPAATAAHALSGTGDALFYDANGLGSCGIPTGGSDSIVALDAETMRNFPGAGSDPNENPICGRQVQVTTLDGKTATVPVVDTCTACSRGTINLSIPAFEQLATLDVGILHGVSWTLL
ncbi:RlpA-like double-psi beta-barrel-protein domain-containing protein-containing protein [Fomes fomentarius]|nr:RlpA-like double-psi beta-barrel-protein domain-containing protein-containing protein [Fomes fomentarius]